MRFLTILFFGLAVSGCSTLSTEPTVAMSGTGVTMSHKTAEGEESRLTYHNPKKVGGEFSGEAWMKINPVTGKVDMGARGGAAGGTDLDLSHAVDHAEVQAETIKDGLKAMRGLAEKFPGLAGGL